MDNRPIGVFDSGLGGLTGVRELRKRLPHEDIIYFGDTGRVPYGSRSPETILQYARQDVAFLLSKNVKCIMAACGTVSSTYPAAEAAQLPVPYLGVVDAAAREAAFAPRNRRIGIIGTAATIRSRSYEKLLRQLVPGAEITARPCPLFVPLVENGRTQPGDVVIALPSSGLHSNGYSLVRKVFDVENADLGQYYGELGCELGEELLRPTKIYVRPVLAAVEAADVRGISHITGGGFYENIPRCIPDGLCAKIEKKALHIPPIFPLLARMGGISERDMFNTFNMGTGMVLVAARDSADKALAALHSLGQEAGVIGEIVSGEEKVALC